MASRLVSTLRSFRTFRTAGIAGALIAAAVAVPTVAAATPSTAPAPTIDSVQKQLGALAMKSDQLVDAYNQATIALKSSQRAESKARAAYVLAERQLGAARSMLSASATAQYEGGSFSAAGALLSSDSGSSYLDQLDTLQMLDSHNAQVVSSFAATQQAAESAKKQADALLDQARAARQKVATEKSDTSKQIDKYTALLSTLNAQQRAAWAERNRTVSTTKIAKVTATVFKASGTVSATVQKAIKFALAQVGKPYVWGSAGPNSYDCSGLTMMSYNAAGISLPHSAAQQYNYGTHVSADDLQPGDLMFYYQPIGHVTLYIGDGMMVSAPETGEDVKVIPADTGSTFTGATRLVT